MKNVIKLAAIHSRDAKLWKDVDPNNSEFNPDLLQKFVDSNTEKMLGFLHEAGKSNVDLVCTHEDFKGSSVYARYLESPQLFTSLVEEIPGSTSNKIAEIANRYHMYVAANYFEKDGNCIYNTTVLIGRNGEMVGKYRKVHLPPSEKWLVTAGKEFPVFETDIGRIGFAICYDILFPEHSRSLALNGADIIVHQTQGWGMVCNELGEALVRVRAAENSVFMLVAKNIQTGDGGKSCIISNYGNILAESEGEHEVIVIAEFEPDFDMLNEEDYNSLYSGVSSIKARQVLEREPSLYSLITNLIPPVLEQYKGMELQTTPDKVKDVYRKWKDYEDNIANDRPVRIKYHW